MASRDSIVRDLLDKPSRTLQTRSFPKSPTSQSSCGTNASSAQPWLPPRPRWTSLKARAIATGLLRPPEQNARRLSTTEVPPVHVGGRPASEIVLEDRG